MLTVTPDYYKDFKCIKADCRHNCCIGWEIDVDFDAYNLYRSLNNPYRNKILSSIKCEDNTYSFILSEGERCPHLNENGLCEIIINCGEESLCDICRLHPRFVNFVQDRTEIGIGLACEEAARIILSKKDKTSFFYGSNFDAEKDELCLLRNKIFAIFQNRNASFSKRITELDINFENILKTDFYSLYSKLERMDSEWDKYIAQLKNFDKTVCEKFMDENAIVFEQLAVYFVYRHFADAFLDNDIRKTLLFVVKSLYAISSICSQIPDAKFSDISDICRMYSCEIEYSDQNIQIIKSKS